MGMKVRSSPYPNNFLEYSNDMQLQCKHTHIAYSVQAKSCYNVQLGNIHNAQITSIVWYIMRIVLKLTLQKQQQLNVVK